MLASKELEMLVTFSRRAEELRASEIRELLTLAGRPDVISFGAGLPPNQETVAGAAV